MRSFLRILSVVFLLASFNSLQAHACSVSMNKNYSSFLAKLDRAEAVFSAHTTLSEEDERKRVKLGRHIGRSGFEFVPPHDYELVVDKIWRGEVKSPMRLRVDLSSSCASVQGGFGGHILLHVASEYVIRRYSQPIPAYPSTIRLIDAYFDMLNQSNVPTELQMLVSSDVVPSTLEITGPPGLVDPVIDFCKRHPEKAGYLSEKSPLKVYWPPEHAFGYRTENWKTESECLQTQLSKEIFHPLSFTLDVVLETSDSDQEEPSFVFGRSRLVELKRPDIKVLISAAEVAGKQSVLCTLDQQCLNPPIFEEVMPDVRDLDSRLRASAAFEIAKMAQLVDEIKMLAWCDASVEIGELTSGMCFTSEASQSKVSALRSMTDAYDHIYDTHLNKMLETTNHN